MTLEEVGTAVDAHDPAVPVRISLEWPTPQRAAPELGVAVFGSRRALFPCLDQGPGRAIIRTVAAGRFRIEAPREITTGAWRLERVQRNGWGLGMTLVCLPSGGVLVYSPTWLGNETVKLVEDIGQPEVLVAPNNFHHLSLERFRAQWPEALPVASADALPRLRAKKHQGIRPLDEAAPRLPPGAAFLEPAGLKNGETWLALATTPGGATSGVGAPGMTWIVADAFFNVERPVTGLLGFALRRLGVTPGPRIGDTFLWAGVRDRPTYLEAARALLASHPPAGLVPCHGEPLRGPDLGSRLRALLEARI